MAAADFDSPWKEALEEYFEAFLAFFFQRLHADIDWSRGREMLDKELQQITPDAELGERTVDKLIRIWLRSGQETWILVHVEVQTWEEPRFAHRMFVYHYRLLDRYNRPVVSLAILADERAGWQPDCYQTKNYGCEINFTFPIVKLSDWAGEPTALERNANPFAIIVLACLKAVETRHNAPERLNWKTRLVKNLASRPGNANEIIRLFRLIDWFLQLPKPLEPIFWKEIAESEEGQHMPFITTPERLGLEKGRKEGRKIGRKAGRKEGLITGLREAIQFGLESQYSKTGSDLVPKVKRLTNVKKLQEVWRLIKNSASIDEIRATFRQA